MNPLSDNYSIPSVLPLETSTSSDLAKNGPSEAIVKPLFFDILEEDQYLKLIIELGIADHKGKIQEPYRSFIARPLNQESVEIHKHQLRENLLIQGTHFKGPFKIEISKQEIFKAIKRKAQDLGIDHPGLIKYHGSHFYADLPLSYQEEIFSDFFAPFQAQIKALGKEHLFHPQPNTIAPNDFDYRITPANSSPLDCAQLIDALVDVFYKKLNVEKINKYKASFYLKKQKSKAEVRNYSYLKEVLKDPETLKPEHPQFWHTFIKASAFSKAANVDAALSPDLPKNVFYIRSFENNDLVYAASLARPKGLFAYHALGVHIDPLVLEEEADPVLTLDAPNGVIQVLSDRRAKLLTSTDGTHEEADLARYLVSCTNGMRCLETEKGKDSLDIVIKNGSKQEDPLSLYLARLLQKLAVTNGCQSPERMMALTFHLSLLLLDKSKECQKEIKPLWQHIFSYLDTPITCPVAKALCTALESPVLSFKDIFHQLQRSCYFSLNFSKSLAIAPINHETPSIRLSLSSYNLLIPYQPAFGWQAINFDPAALQALEALDKAFIPFRSFDQSTSLLKPHCDHPAIQLQEVKDGALDCLKHPQPFIASQASLALLSCLAQKFEERLLQPLLAHFLDKQIVDGLTAVCQGTVWESYFAASSPIRQAYKSFFSSQTPQKRLQGQLEIIFELLKTKHPLLLKSAIELYKQLFNQLPLDKQKDSLKHCISLLLPKNLPEAFKVAGLATAHPSIEAPFKLKLWLSLTLEVSKVSNEQFKVIYFETICQEILPLLPFIGEIEQKNEQRLPLLWLIDQAIDGSQLEKGHQFILMGLKHKILFPNQSLANKWHTIAQRYLEQKNTSGLLAAYHCWTDGQDYKIWDCLEPKTKDAFLLSLSSQQTNHKKTLIKATLNCSLEAKKEVSLLFLNFLEEQLEKDVDSLEEQLLSFTAFIRRYPPTHKEREIKLISLLIDKIHHKHISHTLNQKQTQAVSDFLGYLLENRPDSDYLSRSPLNLLKTSLEQKQLFLVAIAFEKALDHLYAAQKNAPLSIELCQDYFACFIQALNLFPFYYPLPKGVRQQLQNADLQPLLDQLQAHQLHKELATFLAKLKEWSLPLSFADKYLNGLLDLLAHPNEDYKGLIKDYFKTYVKKVHPQFALAHLQLAKAYMQAKDYKEAKDWIEAYQKLSNDETANQLILQSAAYLMETEQTQMATDYYYLIKENLKPAPELNQAWLNFIEICHKKLPVAACISLLTRYSAFSPLLNGSPLIDKIFNRLLEEFSFQLIEDNSVESKKLRPKDLIQALDLLDNFKSKNNNIWKQILSFSAACSDSRVHVKSFEVLYKHQHLLAPETRLVCWHTVLKTLKTDGYAKLRNLLEDPTFTALFAGNKATIEQQQLQQETKHFLFVGLLAVFNKNPKANLAKTIIASASSLKYPISTLKLKHRLDWARILSCSKQKNELTESIKIWQEAIKNDQIKEFSKLLQFFIRDLCQFLENSHDRENQNINLEFNNFLASLVVLPDLSFPVYPILKYLKAHPDRYQTNKISYLKYLFDHPDNKENDLSNLVQLLIRQLLEKKENNSVQALLKHKNASAFLTNKTSNIIGSELTTHNIESQLGIQNMQLSKNEEQIVKLEREIEGYRNSRLQGTKTSKKLKKLKKQEINC